MQRTSMKNKVNNLKFIFETNVNFPLSASFNAEHQVNRQSNETFEIECVGYSNYFYVFKPQEGRETLNFSILSHTHLTREIKLLFSGWESCLNDSQHLQECSCIRNCWYRIDFKEPNGKRFLGEDDMIMEFRTFSWEREVEKIVPKPGSTEKTIRIVARESHYGIHIDRILVERSWIFNGMNRYFKKQIKAFSGFIC
jgi:hypothetical protein